MNKTIKTLLLIQLQLLFVISLVVLFKVYTNGQKIFYANQFMHELLVEKKKNELTTLKSSDIVLGDPKAPLTLFLYTRFDCSACNSFFTETYPKLAKNYIQSSKIQLVVRNLTHQKKPETLYATKALHLAHSYGMFDTFMESMAQQAGTPDTTLVYDLLLNSGISAHEINDQMHDKALEQEILKEANQARNLGIHSTPTLILNNQRLTGSRSFKRYKDLIEEALTTP